MRISNQLAGTPLFLLSHPIAVRLLLHTFYRHFSSHHQHHSIPSFSLSPVSAPALLHLSPHTSPAFISHLFRRRPPVAPIPPLGRVNHEPVLQRARTHCQLELHVRAISRIGFTGALSGSLHTSISFTAEPNSASHGSRAEFACTSNDLTPPSHSTQTKRGDSGNTHWCASPNKALPLSRQPTTPLTTTSAISL